MSDSLDDLLKTLVSGDDEARETAALALGRLGSPATGPLEALISAEDTDSRWWAVRALGEIRGDEVVPLLLRALGDADPDVRACAALALGHSRSPDAATGLAARLADESSFVAGVAGDALAMLGQPAVGPLVDQLQAEDPRIRVMALRALARIKDQSAIGPIFKLLEDPSYLVRFYADEALEALGVGMVYLRP